MRVSFKIIFPKKPIIDRILLRGYAGRYARIDILARAMLLASLFARASNILVSLEGIFPEGETLINIIYYNNIYLFKTEKEAVYHILRTLSGKPTELIINYYNKLEWINKEIKECKSNRILLKENSKDIAALWDSIKTRDTCFYMGAHEDPPKHIEDFIIKKLKPRKASIAPSSLLTTHVISFLLDNYTLDLEDL